MLTIAICDDEIQILGTIKASLNQYLKTNNLSADIEEFLSGEELIDTRHHFDIILLDMKLPGKNGLEVARQLRREEIKSQIIFITSYEQYALEAFHVDAIHYLIKPFSDRDLFHALNKAMLWITKCDCKALTLSRGTSSQVIFIRDILYCESIDHKIYIHTTSGTYDFFGSLETLQDNLDQRFFRCHRSYIVNMNYVVSKVRDTATVTGGGIVFVSRRRQQEFNQKLLHVFRRKVL